MNQSPTDVQRRQFLGQGLFLLVGLSTGTINWLSCASSGDRTQTTTDDNHVSEGTVASNQSVSFGWEITDLNGNGANVSFRVQKNLLLASLNIDVALMITKTPASPGFTEILCQGGVSRGISPGFNAGPGPDYLPAVASSDFGAVSLSNPNNLTAVLNSTLAQDVFYSVILKAFVPSDGSASSASRQVFAQPNLQLNAGDYLMFHMDHAGVPCDGEMQVVLNYTPL